jgi:fibronectin type 3 domain-containing protein
MKTRLYLVLLVMLLVLTVFMPSEAWSFSQGVNCGGAAYTTTDGRVFYADLEYREDLKGGYIGGNEASTQAFIAGTEDQILFQTNRWGFSEYRFDVPDGAYKISLYLAETHFNRQRSRIFDIYIEERPVKKDLDIIAEFEKNQASIISFVARVTDGQLNIRAEASLDQPNLCAVYVEKLPRDDHPPSPPEILQTISHDSAVGLIWKPSPEIDVAGYNIYRKLAAEDKKTLKRINEELIEVTAYRDKNLKNDSQYLYRIKAVDVFGNQSDFSEAVLVEPAEKTTDELVLRINCGGEELKVSEDLIYLADIEYNPAIGYGYERGSKILDETVVELCVSASARVGFRRYLYDVPDDIYKVTLCFTEPKYERPGQRIFNLYIESKQVLEDFDVFHESRDHNFTDKEFITRVEDGQLQIATDKYFGEPILSCLSIVPHASDTVAPAVVSNIRADNREDRIFILWDDSEENDVIGYNVYRSGRRRRGFEKINDSPIGLNYFKDTEVTVNNNYYYKVAAVDASLNESRLSPPLKVENKKLTDDEFLDMIQRAGFEFFWREADQYTGLIKDRTDTEAVSVASVGFGLSAMVLAAERGYRDRDEIEERVHNILKALNSAPKRFGLYFHYLDYDGNVSDGGYEQVISTIDTGLLLMGAITAGEYFGGRIKEETDKMLKEADWQSLFDKSRRMIWMAWEPHDLNNIRGSGYFHGAWDYYTDESIICTLLGISAPKEEYRIPPETFYIWQRNWGKYIPRTEDLESSDDFIYSWSGCTFTYLFAHCWIDFSRLGKDQPERLGSRTSAVDWRKNSTEAIKAARLYCIDRQDEFKTFSENSWGLTACHSKDGYLVVGAMPKGDMIDDPGDGTIAPYGAGSALPLLPEEVMAALKYYYNLRDENGQRLVWKDEYEGGFGFWDSFNLDNGYVAEVVLGIDQGPLILAIENHRSGFIWDIFMENEYIQEGLKRIGFEKIKN